MRKKLLLSAVLFTALSAAAQSPSLLKAPLSVEEKDRFVAVENTGGAGFYWLDTAAADLWFLDPSAMKWIYLGSPRGAQPGQRGTFIALSDRSGGVYILNVKTGEGWRADRRSWQTIGEPSRLIRSTE